MLKDFKTRIKVKSEPEDAFAAFTNPFTIELWSGYPAVMSKEPGSEFSLWEGDITGRVLEVEEEKKIVQEWYFGEREEASIVTLKFFVQGSKVQIDLLHTNIPEEAYDDITAGWNDYYLGAVKAFLEVE